ncbi:MAG: hypothetical protein NT023_08235 [Armatimonadetes bacterium]|nr:hypothetical protein [Armatimonadota bacterium]
MMNHLVFQTGGDWDSTTLFANGEEFLAAQLFVEVVAGRDEWGEAGNGGIYNGGTITAIVRPQDNPNEEIGIFPGRLELTFPGHSLIIENDHPGFAFEMTRVWFDGHDVTNVVLDIHVDINAIEDIVRGYITLYRSHWIVRDEIATYNLI